MNQKYFVIKAIKESKNGVTALKLQDKFGIANPSAVICELRQRGHAIVSSFRRVAGQRVAFYSMPFGTRTEAAKLSRSEKSAIAKKLGIATI